MFTLMIVVFIIGYACIALEHPLHINKSATALLLGTVMWLLFSLGDPASFPAFTDYQAYLQSHPEASFMEWMTHIPLIEHLGEVAEILFFLMGAMTIVEIVDTHKGFRIITDRIKTTKKSNLLWIISIITFFMSSVLDNLTTSIVMIALLRKLIGVKKDRWFFAGMVILAANAGGAWSPIGDVTTIMLWIGGKVSSFHIISTTFLASIVSMIVPLIILSFTMKGEIVRPKEEEETGQHIEIIKRQRVFMFFLGVGALIFVPIFKTITHLPPYLGMLGGLGVLWIVTGFMHRGRPEREIDRLSVNHILSKIDVPSILFFLGILMAVNALATCGQLALLSQSLDKIPLGEPSKYYLITAIIGVLSSVVDNVPLVAGAMGMYNFPIDHYFWAFLAYAAGTGGSILIIGSAAGVAVMGMEKIDFIWYLKKISWLALIGYLAGCATYIVQEMLMGVAA
ncbi:MAG: sodium:proton antiporter NhaD [Dysgonamonadaceae bacterium]|jgi:Na+/H+ antiporter NhaD/arsenite permease-like protein|nr:sodium:proton antiporter NhaD [Dysgonamonadaceae bacterium]